jgi:adenylate cyclase
MKRLLRDHGLAWLLAGLWFLLLVLSLTGVFRLPVIERLDAALYDTTLRLAPAAAVDERIAILDIDEASLASVGRWPWNRAVMSRLVETLFKDYGIAGLGFDVVFAEADESSGLAALRGLAAGELAGDPAFASALGRLSGPLDYDGRFAQSIDGKAVALGYYLIPEGLAANRTGALPPPSLSATVFGRAAEAFPDNVGYGANLSRFQRSAPVAGYFSVFSDADGVIRRVPLIAPHAGQLYESLGVATLRAAFGGEPLAGGRDKSTWLGKAYRQPWLEVAGLRTTLNTDGSVWVPYRAGAPYLYVSAGAVLSGKLPRAALENRILLMGSTAPGLADLRVTPFSAAFPGVEIHANVIAGLLDGTLMHTPVWAEPARLALTVGLGLLLVVVLPLIGPLWGLGISLLAIGGLLGVYGLAWQAQYVLPMAAPLLLVTGLYLLSAASGFIATTRNKRQITRLFGQYVPPELAEEMSRDPTAYSMAGQSREMTVLFSDIRGFTNFSEGLPPTELAEVLNAYLSRMTAIVQQQQGTIDKYIGDAIMAFWNAPLDMPDHAGRAVQTALEMQAALAGLNQEFAARRWPEVKIGVGVNTGRMSVGNMGSEFRMSYTVMGDAVNLGSRLEGITKQYGVGVLVTASTVAADARHAFMKVDEVRVKGKEKPVAIFEPLGEKAQLPDATLARAQRFEAAFAAYQAQRWEDALAALAALQAEQPRALYALYQERIAHYRDAPPEPDWDGVFVYTSK